MLRNVCDTSSLKIYYYYSWVKSRTRCKVYQSLDVFTLHSDKYFIFSSHCLWLEILMTCSECLPISERIRHRSVPQAMEKDYHMNVVLLIGFKQYTIRCAQRVVSIVTGMFSGAWMVEQRKGTYSCNYCSKSFNFIMWK